MVSSRRGPAWSRVGRCPRRRAFCSRCSRPRVIGLSRAWCKGGLPGSASERRGGGAAAGPVRARAAPGRGGRGGAADEGGRVGTGSTRARVFPRRNETGLPDGLKSGIESLSGISLDDVRVHYGSAQPGQLNALAYAQGSEIHLAPGQEQHLPHEAWHVVQQAQGRVQPTTQLQGGVPVNDDQGLEQEADLMGAKALANAAQLQGAPEQQELREDKFAPVQRTGNEQGALQTKRVQPVPTPSDPASISCHPRIAQRKGDVHDTSLPKPIGDFMELRLGADFTGANVHTDAKSHHLNRGPQQTIQRAAEKVDTMALGPVVATLSGWLDQTTNAQYLSQINGRVTDCKNLGKTPKSCSDRQGPWTGVAKSDLVAEINEGGRDGSRCCRRRLADPGSGVGADAAAPAGATVASVGLSSAACSGQGRDECDPAGAAHRDAVERAQRDRDL